MQANGMWTRRRLLKVGGLSVGAGVASSLRVASSAAVLGDAAEPLNAFVYAACAGAASERHGVQVYAVRGAGWEPLQFACSASPSSLTLSPDARTLFVTNGIGAYRGLPTGSVEAWAVDAGTGKLKLLNGQRLALAAVFPSHADVSPDGSTLAVSAANGGSCVVFPVHEDGSVGEPTAVRKELRLASHAELSSTAGATQLCFAADGRLLLADFSEHLLSVLTLASGSLELVQRVTLPAACTSALLQRRATSIDIRLHDDGQRDLGRLSYAGELTGVRSADPSSRGLKSNGAAPLLKHAPSRALMPSLSLQDATFVNTTDRQGSCLLRHATSGELAPLCPTAIAWVRA